MDKKVSVYSTATCPYCAMVKNFLKQNNIPFESFDVGQDREKATEMVQKSGQMGVPVIDIEGQIIVGFDKPAITKALGLQNA
jgi:glutaredoxin-like YruB-family protein